MKRWLAILEIAVFGGGVWGLPLAHHLAEASEVGVCAHGHCHAADSHASGGDAEESPKGAHNHDAGHCRICQFAKAVFEPGAAMEVWLCAERIAASPLPSHVPPAVPSARRLPFACGPPA